MPRYFFSVDNGIGGLSDREGTELSDAAEARDHARVIARELMFRNEPRLRHWRLVVSDETGAEVFALPFMAADDSLQHLNGVTRDLIEHMCAKRLALAQTIFSCRLSILRARATVARSRARPYIAATNGHRI